MFFNEDHLKITKVRTVDGVTPLMINEVLQKKVIYAPYNALTKKSFEEQNTRLPNALKMKIELIKGYNAQAPSVVVDNDETNDLKRQLEELKSKNAELASQNQELSDFKVLKELEAEQNKEAGSNLQQDNKAKTSK